MCSMTASTDERGVLRQKFNLFKDAAYHEAGDDPRLHLDLSHLSWEPLAPGHKRPSPVDNLRVNGPFPFKNSNIVETTLNGTRALSSFVSPSLFSTRSENTSCPMVTASRESDLHSGESVDDRTETHFLFAEAPILPADDCYSFPQCVSCGTAKENRRRDQPPLCAITSRPCLRRIAKRPSYVALEAGQDDDDDRCLAEYIHGPFRNMSDNPSRHWRGSAIELPLLGYSTMEGSQHVIEADGSFTAIER